MTFHHGLKAGIMLALASAAAAQTVAPSPTVQQAFEAAQLALDAGDWNAARSQYQALLGRLSNPQSRSALLVRGRLGSALVMGGRFEDAIPHLQAAVTGFSGTTEPDRMERLVAAEDLARALEATGQLRAARRAFRMAVDGGMHSANSPADIRNRLGLARTSIWEAPDEARALLDALLALPADQLGGKDGLALLKSLRGRVDLNHGQPGEARRWFTQAAADAGGATSLRINLADARIRGDLALANHALGRHDEVQKAIAMSGAGQRSAEGFRVARSTGLPDCAPAGVLPEDAMAIVEFSIADDGRVVGVTPIYATSGTGAGADVRAEELFTQAVTRWSWAPESVAKLEPFWRMAVRVELRCFTGSASDAHLIAALLEPESAWLTAAGGMELAADMQSPADLERWLDRELARREHQSGASATALVPVLRAQANLHTMPQARQQAAGVRLLDILRRNSAPPGLLALSIHDVSVQRQHIDHGYSQKSHEAALLAGIAELEARGDGASAGAMFLRTRLASAYERRSALADAATLLDGVIAAPASVLSPYHPVRTEALLRRSNIAAATKDLETARRSLELTGLSPEQCAAVNVQPALDNARRASVEFPEMARQWNSGGMTRIGFDISADGTPTNVRAVLAVPPLIFSESAAKAVGRFRFNPSYRPGNTLGCTGSLQQIHYSMVP